MGMDIKVLLLDDEPLVQMILRAKLERAGALVLEARNCADALQLARNTDFDVGVLDYRLPDGSGIDFVRELVGEGIDFPVILLSGDAPDLKKDAEDLTNIRCILSKPPNPREVLDAVAAAVGGTVEREAVRVGRYAYWRVESSVEIPAECAADEWLALDFSGLGSESPHASIFEILSHDRSGVAVIGAKGELLARLKAMDAEFSFVNDVEELSALSRHPTLPSERSAILNSIV